MVKKLKWNLVLMSLLYLGLGVFLVMKPGTALNIVCYALGGVVLACAAVQLVRYFAVERGVFQSQLTLVSGIVCLALGAFLIIRSDIVVSILPIVFGLFVIFDAIGRVQNALDLRRCGYDSWKGFLFLPVLSVVLGVVLVINPFGAMETLVMEIPLHIHAHRSDDICTAIRIAKEYDIRIVLVHCTDGIDIAEHIAASGFPAIVGPSMNPCSKQEVWNKSFETAGVLNRAGVKVCITADHDVTPLYYLPIYAAMAVRFGMDDAEALRAVTSYPAEILGIDDRKGALVSGKDADLVIWSHHPLDIHAKAEHVFIEGKQEC